jgi:hypothetical protein
MVHYGSIEQGVPFKEKQPRSRASLWVGGALVAVACVGAVMFASSSSNPGKVMLEDDRDYNMHEPLPFGWKVRYTTDGQKFYLDQLTGMTQYARPNTSGQLGYRYSLPQNWKYDPRLGVPSDRSILTNARTHHYAIGGIGATGYPFKPWTPPPPVPYLIQPAAPTLQAPVPAGECLFVCLCVCV